jgi:hypothetical protein
VAIPPRHGQSAHRLHLQCRQDPLSSSARLCSWTLGIGDAATLMGMTRFHLHRHSLSRASLTSRRVNEDYRQKVGARLPNSILSAALDRMVPRSRRKARKGTRLTASSFYSASKQPDCFESCQVDGVKFIGQAIARRLLDGVTNRSQTALTRTLNVRFFIDTTLFIIVPTQGVLLGFLTECSVNSRLRLTTSLSPAVEDKQEWSPWEEHQGNLDAELATSPLNGSGDGDSRTPRKPLPSLRRRRVFLDALFSRAGTLAPSNENGYFVAV